MWTVEIPDKKYEFGIIVNLALGVERVLSCVRNSRRGRKITLELLISSELETKARGLQVSVCLRLRNVYQNPKW